MKDSKPINRHKALVSFSKDHHFGLLLGWKISQGLEKGISPERISNYVLYIFDNDLSRLFKEEATLLFSLLPLNDPLREKAEIQQGSLFQLIESIRTNKYQPQVLKQLSAELEEHIRFLERELFNHLQEQVISAEFENISSRLSNSSRTIEDAWQDIFWQINNSSSQ